MQQEEEGNATAVDIGIELTAFGSGSSNGNMAYSNPLRKNSAKKSSGRRRHSSTSLSAFEAKTVDATLGGGGGGDVNDKIKAMELKLEEQSTQMKEQAKQIQMLLATVSQMKTMNTGATDNDDAEVDYLKE